MIRLLRLGCIFLVCACGLAAADLATRFAAVAADAPAFDPYRDTGFDQDKLDLFMRDSVGAFDHMNYTEPWTAAVRGILVSGAHVAARSPNAPKRADFLARTTPLFEGGCREPLFLYYHGLALAWSGKADEATTVLNNNRSGMYRSAYPVSRKFWYAVDLAEIAFAVSRANPGWAQEVAPLWQELQEQDSVARFPASYLALFDESYQGELQGIRLDILEAMTEVTRPDHWMKPVLDLKLHIDRAWQARGGGWANTVTEAGWAGFRSHLTLAHQAGLRGLESPQARHFCATKLLTVSLGDAEARERVDDWFIIAVSTDFNDTAPYNAMRQLLLDRWFGTIETQLGYCAMVFSCNRHDTVAPTTGLSMLLDMIDHQHQTNPKWGTMVLRDPAMAAEIQRISEASIPAIPAWANWNRTWLCMVALANGDEPEAARHYAEAQGALTQALFPKVLNRTWEAVEPLLIAATPKPLIP